MQLPNADDGEVIHRSSSYTIRETARFRWLNDESGMQSVMDRTAPGRLLLPIHQAMLAAWVFPQNVARILNLGFGLGAFERTINAAAPDVQCLSVDFSREIVELAKQYFDIPSTQEVIIADAGNAFGQIDAIVDLVFVDLFFAGQNARCLYTETFYQRVRETTSEDAVLAINIIPRDQQDLIDILLPMRKVIPNVVIKEIHGRSNMVIIARKKECIDQPGVDRRIQEFSTVFEFDLSSQLSDFVSLPGPR